MIEEQTKKNSRKTNFLLDNPQSEGGQRGGAGMTRAQVFTFGRHSIFTTYSQNLSWHIMLSGKSLCLLRLHTCFSPTRSLPKLSAHARHRSRANTGPFLLDEYIPRFQLLTPLQESKKRTEAYAHLRECNLCPRLCGVNRFERRGTCLIGADVVVNTVAPHFGEEPCLQGHNGSGSVFFSGCNLRCVFCQVRKTNG